MRGFAAMREEWRLFAALSLPTEIHQRVATVIAHLQARGFRAKWVDPASSHLTIKFFGSVPVQLVPELATALQQSVEGFTPFELHLAGAGAFPQIERPRVLWLGVNGAVKDLARLAKRVEHFAGSFAEERDSRPFHPHITLARIRPDDLASLRGLARELDQVSRLPPLTWSVERLTLYRSELSRSGPRYIVVEEFSLG